MHLLSCHNPQRVYNKYINEYVWVPCGKCNVCKNRKSARYTALLEQERLEHRYCFFVTLTYDNSCIPRLTCPYGVHPLDYGVKYFGKDGDNFCTTFPALFNVDESKDINWLSHDLEFFVDMMQTVGLPYASKRDAQLFLKRLNKYFFDNVTYSFKNFRYFVVSELGSTTFRPHFHGIFYCDDDRAANQFRNAVSACWKLGFADCQFVENSACAYVANYINCVSDLPYVYQNRQLRPFFLCSRNPFIGSFRKCSKVDKEIVIHSAIETPFRRKPSDTKFTNVPLQQSYQNRLFPKCPSFGSLPNSLRIGLYTATSRFKSETLNDFIYSIFLYVTRFFRDDLYLYLSSRLSWYSDDFVSFDESSYNWLRRVYYTSKKVARQACQYGLSIRTYINKIIDYYDKKQMDLLNKFYRFQEDYSLEDSDSIALMYPEWLYNHGISVREYADLLLPSDYVRQRDEAALFSFTNKKCHFKNAYLDSLKEKRNCLYLYLIIKSFLFYGKKCNETIEAFAASTA